MQATSVCGWTDRHVPTARRSSCTRSLPWFELEEITFARCCVHRCAVYSIENASERMNGDLLSFLENDPRHATHEALDVVLLLCPRQISREPDDHGIALQHCPRMLVSRADDAVGDAGTAHRGAPSITALASLCGSAESHSFAIAWHQNLPDATALFALGSLPHSDCLRCRDGR